MSGDQIVNIEPISNTIKEFNLLNVHSVNIRGGRDKNKPPKEYLPTYLHTK